MPDAMSRWIIFFCGLLIVEEGVGVEKKDYHLTYHPKFPLVAIPEQIEADGPVTVDAPLGHYTESPILSVHINGSGPYFFMFDTGWGAGAMISRRLAEHLKLPLAGQNSHHTITPNQIVEVFHDVYFIKELKVGKIKILNFSLNASSGFEDDLDLFKRHGIGQEAGIDGVLGINAFYGFKLTIDYQREKITFQTDSLSKNDKDVLPYGSTQSVPNVDLTIHFHKLKKHSKIVQNFIIDTGNYSYIRVNACRIPEMHEFSEKEQLMSSDFLGNKMPEYFAKLYGDIEILPHYIIHSPYITFASNNCHQRPYGLLGRKFFEDNSIVIDPDDELVKITKN
ncbi:MAG: retropepsin-like aspartic protease [Gammaproteobacteria bacterium]